MFASIHEGIFQCNNPTCRRIYGEYVNGCIEGHGPPRKVVLIIEEPSNPYPQVAATPENVEEPT